MVNETRQSSLPPPLPPFLYSITGAEDIITITPSILLAGTDDRLRLWENARFGPAKTPQAGREGRREGRRDGKGVMKACGGRVRKSNEVTDMIIFIVILTVSLNFTFHPTGWPPCDLRRRRGGKEGGREEGRGRHHDRASASREFPGRHCFSSAWNVLP